MARRLSLALAVAALGCNAVLSIPERELLVDDDSSVGDTATDGTTDAPDTAIELDTASDTSVDTAPETVDPDADVDSGAAETAADSTVDDTLDTATPDTATPDTATPDTATSDTATDSGADTAVDSAMDSATDTGMDSGSCGNADMPCCGAIPASCHTNAVCNQTTKVCVASAGSCVRSSDCPGSACGGPSNCGGHICYACTPTFGAKAFGEACTSRTECKSGVCDTFRGMCSGACSNGITADLDCKVHSVRGVCTELTYGTSGANGEIGFCALGCERDGDCATGKVCRLTGNDDANRVDLACSPPAGTNAYGTACTSGSQCPNGTCITFGSTSLCTPFCKSNADCPATSAWRNCGPLTYTRPKGGTQIVMACVP